MGKPGWSMKKNDNNGANNSANNGGEHAWSSGLLLCSALRSLASVAGPRDAGTLLLPSDSWGN